MVVDIASSPISDARADLVFHALADATRRDIVAVVLREERSVSALARRYPMSVTAVQKHDRAGLVTKTRSGRERRVQGNVTALAVAQRLLDRFELIWRHRVAAIDRILDEPEPPSPPTGEPQ
jgi:DNA-binding transcriptional ArsR family regulator